MFPILGHIGSLPIRSYGLAMALAFIAGIWLARRRAKAAGLNPDIIIDMAFFVIIASIAGARAAYAIVHWQSFSNDPLAVVRIWDGGLALYGGLAAGFLAGLLFLRARRVDPWAGADLVAPSLALGIAIGRFGCFMNGCCFGKPCDLPWAVSFHPDSVAAYYFGSTRLHPTQIYESLAAVAVAVVLLAVERRKPFNGFLIWLLALLVAAYRFAVDPIRYYEPASMFREGGWLDLSSNQVMGLAIALVSLAFMFCLSRRRAR